VQIVSQGNQASASAAEAWDGVVVRANSAIKAPKDLEGKTIAVNALKGSAELSIRAVLARHGVDVSKLKFLEVPFPDQLAALQAGRVDAAAPVEPFVTQARAAGARVLFSYFAGLQPKLTVGTYFAMTPFIQKNDDVVARSCGP
jgi:NitT/TauT family transport system substrate-binding protein